VVVVVFAVTAGSWANPCKTLNEIAKEVMREVLESPFFIAETG
jgi:hypothetical protein